MDQTGIQTWGHIPQLVEHLTRDSGGPSSNPGLVCHYLSHPIALYHVFQCDGGNADISCMLAWPCMVLCTVAVWYGYTNVVNWSSLVSTTLTKQFTKPSKVFNHLLFRCFIINPSTLLTSGCCRRFLSLVDCAQYRRKLLSGYSGVFLLVRVVEDGEDFFPIEPHMLMLNYRVLHKI